MANEPPKTEIPTSTQLATSAPAQASPAVSQAPGPLLFLAEDDPLLTKMYSAKFAKEGFRLLTAGDGQAAYDTITKNKPDFLILDVMMPKLSGLELLEKLRQDPGYKSIPVMMLTNLTQKEEAQKALDLGAKEYLIKANLTPSQVVEKVKLHLRDKKQR